MGPEAKAGEDRPMPVQGLANDVIEMRAVRRFVNEHEIRMAECVALFLMIVGVRFWMIGRFGSDLPFWDQWDAEAAGLFKPFYDGTLGLRNWFAAHNEHRVFFSRLLALALVLANGQWDARLEMLANSLLYSLTACGFFLLFAKTFGHWFGLFWSVTVAVIFSLPFGWENTIAGFQSSLYFLVAFSLTAIWLLTDSRTWSWRWIAGSLVSFAGLFTMGSGLLTAAAVLATLGLSVVRNREDWRKEAAQCLPTAIVSLAVLTIGLMLVVRVEYHAYLQAHTLREFVRAFFRCLAWPQQHLFWSLANWAPFGLLAAGYLVGRLPGGRPERLILGIGIWVVIQGAAVAYSRSSLAVLPSRYADVLSVGLAVNILSACLLGKRLKVAFARKLYLIALVTWLFVNSAGLYWRSFDGSASTRKSFYDTEVVNTEAYLATGDLRFLLAKQDPLEVPHPKPNRLAGLLQDPVIRAVLPVSVREPLPLTAVRGHPVLVSAAEPDRPYPSPWRRFWESPAAGSHIGDAVFECVAQKKRGLPYISFFVNGHARGLVAVDVEQGRHPLVPLPKSGNSVWRPVYAYCPGPECRIKGEGTSDGVAFSEPKEMGRLSLWALIVARRSPSLFIPGGVLFGCVVIVLLMKPRAPAAPARQFV
jgi:hypothetical protein